MNPPVVVIHLDELDWVRLDVDGKVEEVADGVNEGEDKDCDARHLVNVDVVVKREYLGEAKSSKGGDGQSENKEENQDTVEKKGLSAGSGDHVEEIWSTTEHGEVAIVDCPLRHDNKIGHKDEEDPETQIF